MKGDLGSQSADHAMNSTTKGPRISLSIVCRGLPNPRSRSCLIASSRIRGSSCSANSRSISTHRSPAARAASTTISCCLGLPPGLPDSPIFQGIQRACYQWNHHPNFTCLHRVPIEPQADTKVRFVRLGRAYASPARLSPKSRRAARPLIWSPSSQMQPLRWEWMGSLRSPTSGELAVHVMIASRQDISSRGHPHRLTGMSGWPHSTVDANWHLAGS